VPLPAWRTAIAQTGGLTDLGTTGELAGSAPKHQLRQCEPFRPNADMNVDDPASRRTRVHGLVIPNRPKPAQRLVARLVFLVESLVTASLRYRWSDHSGLAEAQNHPPVIFCLWHNRLALSMVVRRRYMRKLTALVSASKDGALLAAVLETFGVEHVRGSSSRRGPQALLELTSRAEQGYDLAVTPDGPKGPRYVVQKGVIDLAQVTGLPIIPVTFNLSRKICLKSWDGFQIPMPFSRCEMILNKPILITREAGEVEREALRLELQQSLRASCKD
jgi:lysophospholipid acyltransferase (LPLAT)-like uncharacterized protein